MADDRDAGKEISLALHPATIIEGRVLAADTGQPIPDAVIAVTADFRSVPASAFGCSRPGSAPTTRGGSGSIRMRATTFRMRAIPPEGQPYLPAEADFAWTKGAVKKEIDLTLPRGVLIRGNGDRTGDRPAGGRGRACSSSPTRPPGASSSAATWLAREDGSFQVAVPPGKGYLMVVGPTLDYVPEEIGGGRLYEGGRPGGRRLYAHAIIAYEVKAGEAPHELNATLKPGKTLARPRRRPGRRDGRGRRDPHPAAARSRPTSPGQGHDFIHARDGRFELPGFDPEKVTPAYFLDADHEWGAAVELSGKQAGEDLTVRLQPCGRAKARFVGPDGKPVARLNICSYVQLLMTPGRRRVMIVDQGEQLAADEAYLPNVDLRHYPNGLATDADGRVTLPDLIPGALVPDQSTGPPSTSRRRACQIRKDFTVKPGETLDLGDILVEKPGLGRLPTQLKPPSMKSSGAPTT